jgi:hypothetical protein
MESKEIKEDRKTAAVIFDPNCAYIHISCDDENRYAFIRTLLTQTDNLNVNQVIIISEKEEDYIQVRDYSNHSVIFKNCSDDTITADILQNPTQYNNSLIIAFVVNDSYEWYMHILKDLENAYLIFCTRYVYCRYVTDFINRLQLIIPETEEYICGDNYIQIDKTKNKIPWYDHFDDQEYMQTIYEMKDLPKYVKIRREYRSDIKDRLYSCEDPQDPTFLADELSALGKIDLLEKHYDETIRLGKIFKYTSKAVDEAASAGYEELVEFWFKLKNRLKDQFKLKMTEKAFDNACINRHIDILQLWKKYDIKPIYSNVAIESALEYNDEDMLKICLDLGLTIKVAYAIWNWDHKIILLFMDSKYQSRLEWIEKLYPSIYDSINISSVASYGCKCDNVETLKWFYKGIKTDIVKITFENLCLIYAMQYGSFEIFKWIFSHIFSQQMKEPHLIIIRDEIYNLFINNYTEMIEYIEQITQKSNFKIKIKDNAIREICRRNVCHLLKDEYIEDCIIENKFDHIIYYEVSSSSGHIKSLQWSFDHMPKLKRYNIDSSSEPLILAYQYGHSNALKWFKYRSRERYHKLTVIVLNKISSDRWTCKLIAEFADNGFNLETTDVHTNRFLKNLQI